MSRVWKGSGGEDYVGPGGSYIPRGGTHGENFAAPPKPAPHRPAAESAMGRKIQILLRLWMMVRLGELALESVIAPEGGKIDKFL